MICYFAARQREPPELPYLGIVKGSRGSVNAIVGRLKAQWDAKPS